MFGRTARIALVGAASVMHAAGHAALGFLGGLVVVRLGGNHPVRAGSSFMDLADPLVVAMAAIAASVVRLTGSTAGAYLVARMSGDVSTMLRGRVLDALFAVHRLRRPRHDDHGRPCGRDAGGDVGAHARAVGALTLHVREVVVGLESAAIAARSVLQIVFLAGVGLFVAPKLFAIALCVLAPFAWALGRVRSRLRAIQREELLSAEALLEAADEAVRHGELWRAFGAVRRIADHLQSLGREARDRGARLAAFSTAQSGANELLAVVAVGLALWMLARHTPNDAALLAPFAVPFFLAYRPLRDFAEARVALSRSAEAARALDGVFAEASDDVATHDAGERRTFSLEALELRDLAHDHAMWSPLTMRIEPGAIVAVVGRTGAGKTTLLRVLLGLEPAGSGDVLYGGQSLNGAPPGPSRPFAWVPQEAPVLAASLEDNVVLRDDDRDGVDARALLESLGATSLLAIGRERIGDGHRPLSGGERQWLSIARALATNAPVLLLDEPTAGLDPESERAVLAALAKLRGTRTIMIVTHREAPIAIADRVLQIEPSAMHATTFAPARRRPKQELPWLGRDGEEAHSRSE